MSIIKTIRHKAQTAKGEAKKGIGRATGNRRLRSKGRAEKAVGDVRKAADNISDVFRR